MFVDINKNTAFISGVVKYWRRVKILKFVVQLKIGKSSFRDIDLWVRFAKGYEVEELDLQFWYPFHEEEEVEEEEEQYWLPQYMYSCSSLKKLSLEGCNLEIDGKVQWDRLKCLEILDAYLDENVVNQILLGSSQLEVLVLRVGESDDSLSICSNSLKVFAIENFVSKYTYQSMDSVLRIWAPNLKKLRMWGVPYGRYLMKNVSSLTLATLRFHGPSHHEYDSCPWNDFLGEKLTEIFPAIQHVEKVVLSIWCIQVLGAAPGKYLLSPCPNVKILKLKGCLEEYEQILCLLETFPNLTRLILEAEPDNQPIRGDDAESFSDLEFQSSSFLLQLRTVTVSWIKGDTSSFPLVELVLKYARHLEKVVFRKRLSPKTFDMEVSSFCIKRTADEHAKVLTKLKS